MYILLYFILSDFTNSMAAEDTCISVKILPTNIEKRESPYAKTTL